METSESNAGRRRTHEVAFFAGARRADPRQSSRDHSAFHLTALGGLTHSPHGVGIHEWGAPVSSRIVFDDMATWTGEWIAVFHDPHADEYIISSDFFGYCPVFYGFSPRGLIVGSSLQGVSQVLNDQGVPPRVNWPIAHPHLVTHETMFNMRASAESFREDVRTLRPDEYLLCHDGKASVAQKSFFADPDGRDAKELISAGIERATAQLSRISAEHPGHMDFNISGGKDSRAVLALHLLAGTEKSVETFTHDPESFKVGPARDIIERDFPIALNLAERYGLKWRRPRSSVGYRSSLARSLDLFQDWRGGQCFEFTAQMINWQLTDGPRIDFVGGGGELYRSHFGLHTRTGYRAWGNNVSLDRRDIRTELARLFGHMCTPEMIPDSMHERARRSFVESLDSGKGRNVLETIDSFYPLQRNRYHFGQMRLAAEGGQFVQYPLAQPEFFWAFNTLAAEDRDGGRLLFDLLQVADPFLNQLPFEHGQWPASFKSREMPGLEPVKTPSNAVVDSYRAMQQHLASSAPNQVVDRTEPSGTTNVQDLTSDSIEYVLRFADEADYLRALLKRIAMTESRGETTARFMAAKIRSVVDAIAPTPARIMTLSFRCFTNRVGPESPRSISGEREMVEIRQSVNIPEIDCELRSESDEIQVVLSAVPESVEAAVYLYLNGEIVNKIWYEAVGSHEIRLGTHPVSGRYRATVFFRRAGMKSPQKVVDTDHLIVN